MTITSDTTSRDSKFSGAFHFMWGENLCYADPSGALYIEGLSLLVVSDLHLEKASSISRLGQYLPPYDTDKTLRKLQATVGKFQPKTILSLGDAFHDNEGRYRLSPSNLDLLGQLELEYQFLWVVGNHDAAEIHNEKSITEVEIERDGFRFVHEARSHRPHPKTYEVSGHYHPCATVIQRGRRLRRRCFIFDQNRMIMPAFGSLTGSLNVSDPIFKPLLDIKETNLILLGERSAHGFPFEASNKRISQRRSK